MPESATHFSVMPRLGLSPYVATLSLLVVSTTGLFVLSLLIGPTHLSSYQLLKVLLSDTQTSEDLALVIWQIRLPRALLGLLIGASLGLSGAALQGYLRNPLAEPGLLGVSSGASLGAVLAFYSGLSTSFSFGVPICGIIRAFLAVAVLYVLAGKNASPITLILAGVAVSSFCAALMSLVLSLSSNPFAIMEIVFWLMGSLADRSMDHMWLAAPFIISGCTLILLTGRALDGLTLGEEVAQSLGVNLKHIQLLLVAGTALSVGAATSVAGAIGFVGLVVPHMLRPFCAGRPSRLLVLSAFGGASLLLAADCAVRVMTPGQELKLGVLTALVGAPFFLMLVVRARQEVMQ